MLPFQDQKIDWIPPSHRRHHPQHSPATNHKQILSQQTTIHKINNTITNHQLLLLCILILFTAIGFLLCVAIMKTDHPHCSPNPNGTLNATSEKIKTLQPWEYFHHYFQTDIQYTMKRNKQQISHRATGLNCMSIIQRAKYQGKMRGQKRGQGQGQGQNHKLLFTRRRRVKLGLCASLLAPSSTAGWVSCVGEMACAYAHCNL